MDTGGADSALSQEVGNMGLLLFRNKGGDVVSLFPQRPKILSPAEGGGMKGFDAGISTSCQFLIDSFSSNYKYKSNFITSG